MSKPKGDWAFSSTFRDSLLRGVVVLQLCSLGRWTSVKVHISNSYPDHTNHTSPLNIQSLTACTTQGQYWCIQTTLALPKVFSVPLRLSAAIEAGVHRRERGKQRPLWKTEIQVSARAHARCRAEKEGGSSLHCLQVKLKYLRVVKI